MHIWGKNGWVQGSLAVQKSPLLKSRVLQLQEPAGLSAAFVQVHSSRLQRLCSTFLATHPAYELLHCDLHVTASKRAKIFMDCILGSMAFVALFFSVDGSAVAARSPEECPVQQGTIWWYTFVALFSIVLNFIPRSFMVYLAWRDFQQEDATDGHNRQLRKRQMWDVEFWFLGLSLTSVQLLVIFAFLANLSEVDEWKWLLSFGVVLLRKCLVVPLLACLLSGLASEVVSWAHPELLAEPPRKLGMELGVPTGHSGESDPEQLTEWDKKVEELAHRGITTRQLLDFFVDVEIDMPHFDPETSTTHDVVRQVIIPNSLQLRSCMNLKVIVGCHGLMHLKENSKAITCEVHAVNAQFRPKPWKGGGRLQCLEQPWERHFHLHHIYQESIHFSLKDEYDQTMCEAILDHSDFGHNGFEGDMALGQASIHVSIHLEDIHEQLHEEQEEHIHDLSSSSEPSEASTSGGSFYRGMDEYHKCSLVQIVPSQPFEIASRTYFDPETTETKGYAYATSINSGRPMLAFKMVTHNWSNKFAHLIGAIFADAQELETYDSVVSLLKNKDYGTVYQMLEQHHQLDVPYWVCAFSVNQHAGICARAPPYDTSGCEIQTCGCGTEKHFEGDLSEMNKFDDMMNYLKRRLPKVQAEVRLEQVVAMDVNFALLTRVWCVAELVEADHLHIHQAVKIHSGASRDLCLERLASSDVRRAEASFPADKDLVLGKIEDVEQFNHRLQDLMLHRLHSFLGANAVAGANLCDDVLGAVMTVAM